jgi:putative FmdB family regulatory protein
MPTYEYQCPEGHAFEKFQKMTEKPRAKCPVCGQTAIRKISGGAGLVFKGTGFYITDYGKDGKGPRKEPTAGSEGGGKSEGGKSEAVEKPAPAKDAPAKGSSESSSSSSKKKKASGE